MEYFEGSRGRWGNIPIGGITLEEKRQEMVNVEEGGREELGVSSVRHSSDYTAAGKGAAESLLPTGASQATKPRNNLPQLQPNTGTT